jgi:hypothetical protein
MHNKLPIPYMGPAFLDRSAAEQRLSRVKSDRNNEIGFHCKLEAVPFPLIFFDNGKDNLIIHFVSMFQP